MSSMFEALAQSPPMAILFAGFFGLLVGSFLNVVIYRVPKMMELAWAAEAAELRGETVAAQPAFNLVTPRSTCPHCGHQIRAWENIPVISWLMLRGKCSSCGSGISARYPIIEAITGLLSAAAVGFFGFNNLGLAAVVFSMILLTLAMIDVDTQLLPDSMTLPLLWLGLAVNLFGLFTPLREAVIGAMLGYLLLWSVYWLFKLVTGKEGMGYGDFKLLARAGCMVRLAIDSGDHPAVVNCRRRGRSGFDHSGQAGSGGSDAVWPLSGGCRNVDAVSSRADQFDAAAHRLIQCRITAC